MIDAQTPSEAFHAEFDKVWHAMGEAVRKGFLETSLELSENTIVAQVLMNWLADCERLNRRNAFDAAEWMGPDWAQALYHAAVYMTRVA